jgi:hypothetical protein
MSSRLDAAYEAIDAENARDPRRLVSEHGDAPAELAYGRRMTTWLEKLEPTASETLRVAVRAQHIRRFEVPRDSYPDGRAGYKQWRSELARRHASHAAEIARRVGFSDDEASRISDLVQKKSLRTDPEAQLLEDVACVVFLEHYFAEFTLKHDRAKLIDIVQKTWRKMSERGRAAALTIPLGATERALVEEALTTTAPPSAEGPA